MKMRERYLWIGALIVAFAMFNYQYNSTETISYLLKSYELEGDIQDRQIMDLITQNRVVQSEEYNRGFEAGRTQAAIAFMDEGSLYNYSHGYHAAIDQFGDSLKNPFSEEKDSSSNDYAFDLLLDLLQSESDTEEAYLDIIEMLVDSSSDNSLLPPSNIPPPPSLTSSESD